MKRVFLAAMAVALVFAAPAQAAPPPDNAEWESDFFESADGTRLHYDLLRPKGLPEDAKTPVILAASPYFNRSGVTPDEDPTGEGPSPRFYDFLEAGKVLDRGYSFLMVDLRGFGGSAGCNDWGGPGEQMDVKSAVEWAAKQEWSTGKVGMYGKSYDGWTGLMGIAQRAEGLSAVVSQEPVYDGYRYLYMNRVRFSNSVATPTLFTAIDANPGSTGSEPEYIENGALANDPACYAQNIAMQQQEDPESDFWKVRNLTPQVKGATTPTFLMQGFLEDNTKPDDAFTFWNNLAGPKRAWFGQWDHVRGTDRDDEGNPLAGREGYAEEAMRFFDQHLKGLPPAVSDPPVVIEQGEDGRFRSEQQWPPADSRAFGLDLVPGEYRDQGTNDGDATGFGSTGDGSWTFSEPFPHAAHLSGTPRIDVDLETQGPRANLVANVYEISLEGSAQLLSRGAYLVPESGRYSFELYGQDWTIEPGERIGVLLSGSNSEWWVHAPTQQTVTVKSGRMDLPFLANARTEFIQGSAAAKLTSYLEAAPFEVDQAQLEEREAPFAFPPPLRRGRARGAGGGAGGPGTGAGQPAGTAQNGSQPEQDGVEGDKPEVRLRMLRLTRRAARAGRVRASIGCDESCTFELSGTVVSGRRRAKLPTRTFEFAEAGQRTVTLFARSTARRLLARGGARVRLRAFVSDLAGNVERAQAVARRAR